MTRRDKLTKLIDLAVENGYKKDGFLSVKSLSDHYLEKKYLHDIYGKRKHVVTTREKADRLAKKVVVTETSGNQTILFSHEFSKAIFGRKWHSTEINPFSLPVVAEFGIENKVMLEVSDPAIVWFIGERWQYHLQQAVISEDPLEYYWKNK